jgi:hypothetical protein
MYNKVANKVPKIPLMDEKTLLLRKSCASPAEL